MFKRIVCVGMLFGVGIFAATCGPLPNAQQEAREVTPAAVVKHPPIDEMSGIVKSRRYPNTYWVHNDSGDVSRLFAIRANGTAIMPPWLSETYYVDAPAPGKEPYPGIRVEAAANIDWEDIAIDGDTLYVQDVGNNGNSRRDLGVYVLTEPNPEGVDRARVLQWLPIAYPDQEGFPGAQWHFDCEAIFVFKRKLYFVTKHRAGQIGIPAVSANLYRLDTRHTDKINVLKKVDSKADLGGWVTGADLSPDGKTLAVLCHAPVASVWLFQSTGGDKFLSGSARRMVLRGADQCEAVCFEDNETLLVTNEQRAVFRLKTSEFTPVRAD